jgi:hypothetical protein
MKKLKHLAYLFFALLFIVSCEKESELFTENNDLNLEQIKKIDHQAPKSIREITNSGVDLETYFKSLGAMKKMEATETSYQLDDFVQTELHFFYDPDDFPCSNLPSQNFPATNYGGDFAPPLNEFTENFTFSPGDIVSGISFDLNSILPYVQNSGFFIPSNSWGYPNILMSNYWEGDLVLNFTNNNVTEVSMKLFNLQSSEMFVSVYGASENYLGQTSVYYSHPNYGGVYVGIQSDVPIGKIVISSGYIYGYEGIDEVSFGTCDDMDGDGFLNEVDAHPNSDMSEKINIGGCYPNVDNKMVKNGTMMMDQINDLIAKTNAQYNGENYTYLHKRFMTELSQITYRWRIVRLVTATQRTRISSCAWGANIPFYIYPI